MPLVALLLMLVQDPVEPPPEQPPPPGPSPTRIVSLDTPLSPRDLSQIPHAVAVIERADLDRRLTRATPEALIEIPGVAIHKTALGQVGAAIRGFTGARTLLLLDGIRMNTSIFRDDPDSTWTTVDPFLVDRMEVVRGAGNVLFGLDAPGGTVYAQMRAPERFPEALELRMRTVYRYSSAEDSHAERVETTALSPSGALFAGFTLRDFHDLTGGRHVGEMPRTGYDELDLDGKVVVNLGDGRSLTFGMQGNRQYNVPRTHRTADSIPWHGTVAGTDLRHRTDQERDFFYLQFRWEKMAGPVDGLEASASYHRQFEELDVRTAADDKEFRQSEVRTGGFFLHAVKETSFGRLTFGGDFYVDVVNSRGFDRTAAGALTTFDRGEVADDSVYDLAGAFVQDEIAVGSRVDLTLGLRYTFVRLHAIDVDPSGVGAPPLDEFEERFHGVGGTVRFLYRPADSIALIAGVTQGFRAPNLDETTSIRDVLSGVTDNPNPDLDAERFTEAALGARAQYESFSGSLFAFYTWLDGFIDRRPEPSLGPGAFVRDNFDGYVYGVELSGEYRLCTTWAFWVDFAWALGQVETVTGAGEVERPLSRMNPAMAHLGVRYAPRGATYWVEGVITAARHQERLSPTDELDLQRIPAGGTPGWTAITLRGGLELLTNIRATVAIENISNKDFRLHGSGQNEAGTNFVVALDVTF